MLLTRLAPGDCQHRARRVRRPARGGGGARAVRSRSLARSRSGRSGRGARCGSTSATPFSTTSRSAPLVRRAAANTAALGVVALLTATACLASASASSPAAAAAARARAISAASFVFLSMPPLLTSLLLVFVAARTGWLPTGRHDFVRRLGADLGRLAGGRGPPPAAAGAGAGAADGRNLRAAAVTGDRRDGAPAVRARRRRARRAAGGPGAAARLAACRCARICGVYGLAIGALLSGSFVVEYVDRLARARSPDVRGAARARHLSRRRLRGDGRAASWRSARWLATCCSLPPTRACVKARRREAGRSGAAGHWCSSPPRLRHGWRRTAPDRRFDDLPYAPPTRLHLLGAPKVDCAARYIYRWRLVSRLERRFEEDRSSAVQLRWFTRAGLVTADPESRRAAAAAWRRPASAAIRSRACSMARASRWRSRSCPRQLRCCSAR